MMRFVSFLAVTAVLSLVLAAQGHALVQEMGPESMNAAAKRTAKEIAKELQDAFRRRGWI